MAAAPRSTIDAMINADVRIEAFYKALEKTKSYGECSSLIIRFGGQAKHINLKPPSLLLIKGAGTPADRHHLGNCIEVLHQEKCFSTWLDSILDNLQPDLLANLILAIKESAQQYALMSHFLTLFKRIVEKLEGDNYFFSDEHFQAICQICNKNFWQTWLRQLAESKDFATECVIAYFFECIPDTVDPDGAEPNEDLRNWLSKEAKAWCATVFVSKSESDAAPPSKSQRTSSLASAPGAQVALVLGAAASGTGAAPQAAAPAAARKKRTYDTALGNKQ